MQKRPAARDARLAESGKSFSSAPLLLEYELRATTKVLLASLVAAGPLLASLLKNSPHCFPLLDPVVVPRYFF